MKRRALLASLALAPWLARAQGKVARVGILVSTGYVDRLLNGAKAAELPIERSTSFQFVVNASAARAIGVTLPQSMLLRADRVIR